MYLEKNSNDDDYILLNKIQILNNIYINYSTNHNCCSYYKLLKSFNYIPLSRLNNNDKWLNINNKIWNKIYSNIQVDFDYDDMLNNFISINKLELLYDIDDTKSDTSFSTIN